MTLKFLVLALVASLMSWAMLGCGKCEKFNSAKLTCEKSEDNSSKTSCPDPSDTSIKGNEIRKSTTLDKGGRWNSQVHLETATTIHGFHHLDWRVGHNRQTCAIGYVSDGSGFQQYLQITASPGTIAMRVVPGKNYIDYEVRGCKSLNDVTCETIVEAGTIVLDVNYVP